MDGVRNALGSGPGATTNPTAGATALVLAVSLVGLVLGLVRVRDYFNDDAFISLRYASRLSTGRGLTWTDGERVEGFSNPLWVLETAVAGAAGAPLEPTARALGVVHLAVLCALMVRARIWPWVMPLVATHSGVIAWSVSGLETTAFATWLALGSFCAWRAAEEGSSARREAVTAAACFAAAALTRPEGLAAGLLALGPMVARCRSRGRALQARDVAIVAVIFALPVLSYEAFRLTYYGDALPNVAHAKGLGVPFIRRWEGALDYVARHAILITPAAACALVVLTGAVNRSAAWMILPTAAPFAGVFFAAGDYMPMGRLLVPVFVLVVLATGVAGRRIRPAFQRPAALVACAGALIQVAAFLLTPVGRDSAAAAGVPVGRFLERNLAAGSLVALATAGSTPFHAPSLRFLDTVGLNDRHIARRPVGPVVTRLQRESGHFKGDGGYVLSRRPDVIVLGPAEGYLGRPPDAWFLTDYELLNSAEFRYEYRPVGFAVPVDANEAARPRVKELLLQDGRSMRFIAYLRLDSRAARDLAYQGRLLAAPWEGGAAP